MPQPRLQTASDLYALSQGTHNSGEDECHWCSAPCPRVWLHDDPPPVIGVRRGPQAAKRPGTHYTCVACRIWRRPKVTLQLLGGGYQDGQCPMRHSHFFCEKEDLAVPRDRKSQLYEVLLDPPRVFVVSLVEEKENNFLHMAILNQEMEIKADTPLWFTLNGIALCYSVYELELGLRKGPEGREPGVGAIIKHLGPYDLPEEEFPKRGRGRPHKEDRDEARAMRALKKLVRASGC